MAELPFQLDPAFVESCNRLAAAFGEAARRAMFVQACMFADMLAGRTPREPAAYLLDAGIDVKAEGSDRDR